MLLSGKHVPYYFYIHFTQCPTSFKTMVYTYQTVRLKTLIWMNEKHYIQMDRIPFLALPFVKFTFNVTYFYH